MKHIPNLLTFFRLLLLPIIIILLYQPALWMAWVALALYAFASFTDFLDGWVARKFDASSDFGKFLDPISDKIFVVSLLIVMVDIAYLEGIWILPVLIILTREFLVSGLREFLGPQNIQLPVTQLAKWKTTIQMIALGFLIAGHEQELLTIGKWGMAIAALLTAITGYQYVKAGMKHLKA